MVRRVLRGVRRSYLAKFLVAVVVLTAAGGFLGAYFYVSIGDTLDEQVDRQVRSNTELRARVYGTLFSQQREILQSLAEDGVLVSSRDPSEGYVNEMIVAREQSDLLSSIHLVNGSSGVVIASPNVSAVGENLYDRRGIDPERIRDPTEYVTTHRFESFDGRPAVGLFAHSELTDRVVVAEVDQRRLELDVTSAARNSTTHVVNRGGEVLFGPRDLSFVPPERPRSLQTVRDDRYLYAYAPIEDTDLLVVTRTPVEEAFRVKDAVLVSLSVQLALLFALFLGASVVWGRSTVAELSRLVEQSRAMARGDMSVDLETTREDEIGDLYRAFAEMRDQIEVRIREVEKSRASAQEARAQLQAQNERLQRQQAIIGVLNRVLRHNIRNGLAVVSGYVELVEEKTDGDCDPEFEAIHEKVDEVVETADKARAIERLLEGETASDRVDVTATLRSVVEDVAESDPTVDVEVERSIEPDLVASGHETIRFVLTNVLENAIQHNDGERPWVEVSARDAGEGSRPIEIAIADDGPGIPEEELDHVRRGTETPVEHASGLGLWIVRWLVEEMDGTIEFDDRSPRGTVVRIRLQRYEEE